jgi:hypothetical protein
MKYLGSYKDTEMSSESFFCQKKKDLIEHILVLERRHNGTPIIFCFNRHFFQWGDIDALIDFMNANAVIKRIQLTTNEGEYKLDSVGDYRALDNIDFQVLREFNLWTKDPHVEINMSLTKVHVSSYVTEDTKEKEAKITEHLSTFLNEGRAHKGWFCLGTNFSLQQPPNSPNIDKLGR